MKKISLLAALLVAGVSSAVAESFNGGYVGATLGLKATRAGAFDTGSMGATNPEKFHLKRKGLTGGLSLGWGGEVAPNFYLGLHIDMTVGSGGKKVETKGKLASSADAYVPAAAGAAVGGFTARILLNAVVASAYGYAAVDIPAYVNPVAGAPTHFRIVYANAAAINAAGPKVPIIPGSVVPLLSVMMAANSVVALGSADDLDVKETISVKDRCSITPLIQLGYIFKAALAGKDMLVYGEVGPHIAFTKLSIESKITTAGIMRIRRGLDPLGVATVAAEAFDGALEKTQKSSVGVGIALGTGVKVAVSNNLVVSLGYRFTKIPGNSVKATFGDNGLKKLKIPSQSHNILVGLNYAF